MILYRVLLLFTAAVGLIACAATTPEPLWKAAVEGDGPGINKSVTPEVLDVRNLPKSRSGNRREYEVFGIRYSVLDSARNFRERGTASWYGTKFHGKATSSGEIYDMYQMTAAHKHLPLPTFVRVTRVDNGQSIVVKVNDRGPFVDDRVIDLSYAAATRLDMLEHGKAEVVVEAISDHGANSVEIASRSQDSGPSDMTVDAEAQGLASPDAQLSDSTSDVYIQLGAFGTPANAEALRQRVQEVTQMAAETEFESARQLYRVVVGPLQDEGSIDHTLQTLASSGFGGYAKRRLTGKQSY